MIIVKKVNWIDENSVEADISLSDGMYSIDCFCSDCNLVEGDKFTDILYGFSVRNVVRIFNQEFVVNKKNDSYSIQGKLVDRENEILQIGEFKIDLSDGSLAKDIEQDEYVEVDISRIDIY